MIRSYLARGLKFIADDALRRPGRSYSTDSAGRLEGKVALITGGASALQDKREFIKQTSHNATSIKLSQAADCHCDVTAEAQVENAVAIAMTRYGKLDIMYNNAGITGPSFPPRIADLDLNEFDKVMQINARGVVAGIKHAARAMIPAGSGCILCTSSISGLMGGLGPHSYAASKSAIPGIVKSAASELCGVGVRINCISPGPVPTPLSLDQIGLFYPGASREQLTEMVNGLGKLKGAKCEEIDVAKAALFLASDEAKYITGHNLVVDGGLTCFTNLALPPPREFV
uniref:Uncharacterized protein n=1 Tax=Salix viminalis TaxID=40686 RepID=A0A6N2ML70_SALVM